MKYLAFKDFVSVSDLTTSPSDWGGLNAVKPNRYTIMEFEDHDMMHTFLFLSPRKPVPWSEIKDTDHIRFEKYTDESEKYMIPEDKIKALRGL